MAAPKGNQFWKLASDPGRETKYKPEELWKKACDYFAWCDANPWVKKDFVRGGESAGKIVDLHTARPYTLTGFCVHAGIALKTFQAYEKRQEFVPVTTRIKEIAYTQKFEGAAVGAFNANLIARELGLADKQETKFNGDIDHHISGMIVK
jgi:hypothetical protein